MPRKSLKSLKGLKTVEDSSEDSSSEEEKPAQRIPKTMPQQMDFSKFGLTRPHQANKPVAVGGGVGGVGGVGDVGGVGGVGLPEWEEEEIEASPEHSPTGKKELSPLPIGDITGETTKGDPTASVYSLSEVQDKDDTAPGGKFEMDASDCFLDQPDLPCESMGSPGSIASEEALEVEELDDDF